jgi:hypothetical protein
MAQHGRSCPRTCHPSSLSPPMPHPIRPTSYPPSFSLALRSRLNTTANFTRDFSDNHRMASFVSASNHTLTRSQIIGGSLCLIFPPLGRIYVRKASQSPNTSHLLSFTPGRLLSTSAPLTLNANALVPFSPPFTTPILIATRGWQVLGKKSPASNRKTLTLKPALLTIRPFGHKGLRGPSSVCVCSQ